MAEQIATVTLILYYTLAVGTVLLPMRWSLLSFALLAHIDVTNASFASASSVGIENGVKTLVLPTILFLRFCRGSWGALRWSRPLTLWTILVSWAAISVIWSPFRLSGFKMVGYLYCYAVVFVVLLEGWRRGALTPPLLGLWLWISLALAGLQTWMFDNFYGRALAGSSDDRFTSFCTPQLFAASLAAILSVLLVTHRLNWPIRLLHISGAVVGLLLCGSRYVFVGAILMVAVVWFGQVFIQRSARRGAQRLMTGLCVGTVLVGAAIAFFQANTANRIGEFLAVLGRGESPFSAMGTLVWRKGIYDQALRRIEGRRLMELCFGSGTSSGATIVLGYDLRYNEHQIDANRVVHNEFLRALYEWGILGLLVFVSLFISLTYFALRAALFERVRPALAFLSLIPTVFLGCLSENLLAGASSPAGVGIVISLTYGVAHWEFARHYRENPDHPLNGRGARGLRAQALMRSVA